MHASQERSRERILTQADPARVRKSRDAVVLKEGSTFLVATESGDVPFRRPHGFGIFFKDCRFLDGYELSVNGTTPTVLSGLSVRARVRDLPPFDQPQAARQERPCVHPSEHDRDPAPEAHSRRSRARAPVGPELRARPCAPAHRDLTWRATFEDIFVVVRHAKGTPRRPQVQDDDHVELG